MWIAYNIFIDDSVLARIGGKTPVSPGIPILRNGALGDIPKWCLQKGFIIVLCLLAEMSIWVAEFGLRFVFLIIWYKVMREELTLNTDNH